VKPIVLIHGYSAESKGVTKTDISGIYGELPARLRTLYGTDQVFTINLSRYVTLEDGLTVDDVTNALDVVLNSRFKDLLEGGFHVIAHSTGALVVRNWISRYANRYTRLPLERAVYLAGANFGSGWGHIGRGQFAKWARHVFQGGGERGVKVLSALELGSSWTLDLHHGLATSASPVLEAVIIGTEADVAWYEVPVRYAKEDGSDGVIRASAANLNFHYARLQLKKDALINLSWKQLQAQVTKNFDRSGKREEYYELDAKRSSRPGEKGRAVIPFAIPHRCAHSGETMGVVSGEEPAEQILRLIRTALETSPTKWDSVAATFDSETRSTYDTVLTRPIPKAWKRWLDKALDNNRYEPAAQYDPHAQIIVRVRDQDGRAVRNYDVFFDSLSGVNDSKAVRDMIEDKHINSDDPNVIVFYLRASRYDKATKTWVPQIPKLQGLYFEVTAIEPDTEEIAYVPMRFEFKPETLQRWIRDHTTTILDVVLHRVSSPAIYHMVR
jgi:pimeloyl-ACP methyl ester carboxylesterase